MKYKTEWDLAHIYKGDIKKLVAKDCADLKRAYTSFAKKYRNDKNYLRNAKSLAKAIEEYEKLIDHPASDRPSTYYFYRKSLNSQDNEAQAEIAKLSDFFTNLNNQIKFFRLEIGKLPKEVQTKFLASKELKEFKFFLERVFYAAKYKLTEAEEKILDLKGIPAHQMWTSGFSKLLSKQTVKFGEEEIPIAEATNKIQTLPKKQRRELYSELVKSLKSVSDFAESEINAIATNKKSTDQLRGYKKPYEATVVGYQNEMRTIEGLVKAVTANFKIAHRFYKIKAEMLGEQKLLYSDRAATVGETEIKIPLNESIENVINSFNNAGKEFGDYVQKMFENGQVDVFPKKGKAGGAFCSTGTKMPTYILLNHVNDFNSMTTIAHEMGHGLHAKFFEAERPIYQGHSTASAEVASTFFETIVFQDALSKVDEKERMILLHDKIADDITTIFRQIACFNFENEMHESVRKEGFLPKDKLAELMSKHLKSYLGPTFNITNDDGYAFVGWPHIRRFFYVYSYAFGQLVSAALYEKYKQDKNYIKQVVKFLSAGSSNTPEGIFRSIGINPTKQFFELGLKKIDKDIDELEKLWKKNKRAKK